MSPAAEKYNKIRHIVKIRRMLRRWRKKASSGRVAVPDDVLAGHVAICVGRECRRFVLRATYLNHPIFRRLLAEAEEEYGFDNRGPLVLPCDESVFEEILRVVSCDSGRFINLEDIQRFATWVVEVISICWGILGRCFTGLLINQSVERSYGLTRYLERIKLSQLGPYWCI